MEGSDVWYGVVTSRSTSEGSPLKPAGHPFLRGVSPEFIEAISKDALDLTYETGDLLVREGDVADRFFLLFHGKVAIEVVAPGGLRRTVQTVGPGEVLGWSWVSAPYVWQFDGRALKPTRVVALDTVALRTAMEQQPAEGYRFLVKLLPVIGQRLENTRAQVLEIGGA